MISIIQEFQIKPSPIIPNRKSLIMPVGMLRAASIAYRKGKKKDEEDK